jgi:hypothetical protein
LETDVDLFAFGNRRGPKGPRATGDFGLEFEIEDVPAQAPPLPMGASAFGDPLANPTPTGPYFQLAKGTVLPNGIAVVRDDKEAWPDSPAPRTHHTFYPTVAMPFAEFRAKFLQLPWQYVGRKE